MAALASPEDCNGYDYDYDDGSLSASEPASRASLEVRQVALHRRALSDSFGFTLRHFIAYPDDEDEQDGAESSSEPLETIFVSGVVPGGPAYLAGLQIGDRVIEVNGRSVWQRQYADVVRLVQASGHQLHLLVVPRHNDELQRAWGETAHHPASNLNMKPTFSHLPRPQPYRPAGSVPLLGQLTALGQAAAAVAAPHLSHATEDSASLNGDRPGAGARRASTLSTLSLQMPPPAEHNPNDPVYSRIKKAVETKAEFLSRPAQPAWQAAQPQTPVVREYHVNPARFARPPWPPEAPAAAAAPAARQRQEPERRSRRRPRAAPETGRTAPATAPVSSAAPPAFPAQQRLPPSGSLSLSSSADSLPSLPGSVQNATARPYAAPERRAASTEPASSPEYVQYDAVTQVPRAKLPPPDHKTHIVSKRARQFETGRVDNDTFVGRSTYQNELELLAADAQKRPSVRARMSEFERDPDASDNETSEKEEAPRRPPRAGNRMVIVGGPRLHAEPTTESWVYRESPKRTVRGRSDSGDSQAGGGWPFAVDAGRPLSKISEAEPEQPSPEHQRKTSPADGGGVKVEEKTTKETPAPVTLRSRPAHRALRQPSYMAAVKTPTPEVQPSAPVTGTAAAAAAAAPAQPPAAEPVRPSRPTFLPVAKCYGDQADLSPVTAAEESLLAGDPDTKSPPIRVGARPPLEPSKTSTPTSLSLLGVVRRQKPNFAGGEDDTDRTVRRISYLKATSGDFHSPEKDDRSTSIRAVKPSSPTWPQSPPSGPAPAADAQREGWLRVKLAQVDGKRAPDRSWRELWTVLRGDSLSFFRDRKEVSMTPTSLEEQPVNVALCQLDAAEDYTRRKHVFRLLSHTGSEYLLQTEHLLEREAWLEALRPVCAGQVSHAQDDSSRSLNDSSLLSPTGARAMKKLTSFRQRSPTGLGPNAKSRKQSQTPAEQTNASPKSKTWKGRVARQLKKIHVGSPVTHAAQPVPDGSTLGVPLELCPPSASNEFVPALVEMCTSLVEERGLDTEGIYRVPGNNAAIKSLSEAVNRGVLTVNLQADPRWTDVNVISSLLKSFFRKLPDSLVTSELYPQFIDVSKIEDPERRKLQLRKLLYELPEHNYETLKYLIRHLRRVAERTATNKMDLKNLAIVFGPTLVRSSDDSTSALVTDMSQQCGIVKTLISEYDWFFPAEEPEDGAEDVPPPLPDSSPPLSADILGPTPPHRPPLLSPVQRLDSQGSPLAPKDLVSSIILAANRKAQQGRRPDQGIPAADAPEACPGAPCSASECNNNQVKPAPLSSSEAAGSHRVHVIPIRLTEDEPPSAAASHTASSGPSPAVTSAGPGRPPHDETAIPSYAGLSQNTQERIRRFEEETRANLQRDKIREREAKELDLQRARIEREWARAKQDLEHPDFLDELADNPADVARRLAELGRLQDRDERLSVASDGPLPPPPASWDTLSSGYSTMSSGTGPRPAAAAAGRRASEGGERSRWLAPSQRLYRSPRPARRGGSAEDVGAAAAAAAAQTRKAELKRSEMALKGAREPAKQPGRPRASTNGEEGGSPDGASPPSTTSGGGGGGGGGGGELSSEGCDLVASLVHTLDQKLQALGGRPPAAPEKRASWSAERYRDPSLHRSHSASSQLQMMNGPAAAAVAAAAAAAADRTREAAAAPRRPAAAGEAKKGMKRSIRQLCERFEPRPGRAAHGSPRALKRRHTVGGSKDIDRVLRLLLAASEGVRPASCLVELDLLPASQPVPLESRV